MPPAELREIAAPTTSLVSANQALLTLLAKQGASRDISEPTTAREAVAGHEVGYGLSFLPIDPRQAL